MRKYVAIFLLVFLPLTVLANSGWIEARGVSVIIDGKKELAYQAAINDALKKAVETGVGVYVSAETKTENFTLINDSILTRALGYVETYSVLSVDYDESYCYVAIRAFVSMLDLKDDLEAQGLLIKRSGDPRVVVILEETAEDFYYQGRAGQSAVEETLKKNGFNIIKSPVKDGCFSPLKEDDFLKQVDADLLVLGKASASLLSSLGGMYSYGATVNLQIYKQGSKQMIGSVLENARGIHPSREIAVDKAFTEAARLAAQNLSTDIIENLTGLTKRIQLEIEGLDYNYYVKLAEDLGRITGIDKVYPRNYTAGVGVFDLDTTQSALAIALYLNKNFSFEIVNQTEIFIVARFQGL